MRELTKGEFEQAWGATMRKHHVKCRIPEGRSPLTHFLIHGLSTGGDLLADGGLAALEHEQIWASDKERETFNSIWRQCFERTTQEGEYLQLQFGATDLPLARPLIILASLAGWNVRTLSPSGDRSVVIDHDSNVEFACSESKMLSEFDWAIEVSKKWNDHASSGNEW